MTMKNIGREVKIKEAIYVNAINPTKAVDIYKKAIMNLEKGYDLDPMWSDFNQVHRQTLAKKFGGVM